MKRLCLIALLTAVAGCASNRSDETDRMSDTTAAVRDTVDAADTVSGVREGPSDSVGDNR
jgi:hypothetical protein